MARLQALCLLLAACSTSCATLKKNEVLQLDADLACSATKEIAGAIQTAFAKLMRANKNANAEEKAGFAAQALEESCAADRWREFAVVGEEGRRTYGNFNKMMSAGGSLDNLHSGPKVGAVLVEACEAIRQRFGVEIASGMGTSEGMYGFKLKKRLVKDMVQTCKKEKKKSEL